MLRRNLTWLLGLLILAACTSPGADVPATRFSPSTPAAVPTVADTPAPTEIPPSPTPACTNDLVFIEDETIPDGTAADPGEQLDKRWRVQNTGTCNWDETYGLVLVTGSDMGAVSPQPLYPARAGAEGVLRILFTAPEEPGIYRSAWQPAAPDGTFFGDSVFIEIVVP